MTELEVKPKFGEGTPIIGDIEGTDLQVYNRHGHWFAIGPGHSMKILDEIEHNRSAVKQNMIIVVGSPGGGKTYYAMRLAQLFDPQFNPTIQVVFERSAFLRLIGADSPLKMGQAIIVDEAQFVMSARTWQLDIQKDVLENIEAVRSAGYIIIIVALHLKLMDVIIRDFVLSMMVDMENRGVGKFYRLRFPTFANEMHKTRLGRLKLSLPDVEWCEHSNCLKCEHQNRCMTCRAVYERMKKKFLAQRNSAAADKSAAREHKQTTNFNDYIEKVIAHEKEMHFTKTGKLIPESVRIIMEKHYHDFIPKSMASTIAERGAISYPDIFKRTPVVEVKKE